VYNESINDLLAPTKGNKNADSSGGLAVKEDAKEGRFFVKGLTDKVVGTAQEVQALLDQGLGRRQVGHTNMNAESSRSHAVFTIVVERDGASSSGSSVSVSSVDPKKPKSFTAGE
jgi:hypothetical protein